MKEPVIFLPSPRYIRSRSGSPSLVHEATHLANFYRHPGLSTEWQNKFGSSGYDDKNIPIGPQEGLVPKSHDVNGIQVDFYQEYKFYSRILTAIDERVRELPKGLVANISHLAFWPELGDRGYMGLFVPPKIMDGLFYRVTEDIADTRELIWKITHPNSHIVEIIQPVELLERKIDMLFKHQLVDEGEAEIAATILHDE